MSSGVTRPILVTGGTGFIGSHLVEALLRRGDRVAVVDLTPPSVPLLAPSSDSGRYSVHALDLTRDDARPLVAALKPSIVFHLAGHTRIPESWNDPRLDVAANAMTTVNVVEAVRHGASDAKVIFASSAAVYGEGTGVPFREQDAPMPIAPYGVSKLASESYLNLYARIHGLKTASLRLFNVYGPRQRRHVIYDLMRRIRENPRELVIQGDGRQIRDFVYVANVADAFLLTADAAPLAGEVYNVGGDEPTSIADLAQLVCEKMGASPRLAYTGSVATGISLRWVADSARLRALGYGPRVRLADGLTETVAWFLRANAPCE